MHTNTQGFPHNRATPGAPLTGIAWVNQCDPTTGAFSLVRRVLHQLIPGGVSNALGKVAVLEHVPDVQIFKGDQAELVDQTAT
jgi:hypothetical protein